MALSDTIKTLIRNAWDDGYPCLLASHGPEGPNITPKGCMIVFDDTYLAWWERSKRAVLENLSHDKRVCVMYANFKAQRDGVLESGFLRFFGSVELYESGPVREAIFAKLLPREQTHVGAEAGIGVLIKIDKAIDIRGKPIMWLLSLSALTPCHTRRFRGYADQLGFLSQACLARPLPGTFSSLFRF